MRRARKGVVWCTEGGLLLEPGQEGIDTGTGNREIREGRDVPAQGDAEASSHEFGNAVNHLLRDDATAGNPEEKPETDDCRVRMHDPGAGNG